MPRRPEKEHRIRVRVLDGKARDGLGLARQLAGSVDVFDVKDRIEFVVCAAKIANLRAARAKLGAAGLEEIPGDIRVELPKRSEIAGSKPEEPARAPRPKLEFKRKPYAFVSLPTELKADDPPIWHDGAESQGLLSGEVRFELTTLTPMLVGWERQQVDANDDPWPIEHKKERDGVSMNLNGHWSRPISKEKAVLCPLRAPWGAHPVVISGDSLKGLLRHELGALLGAPMERVAERSYSYRPYIEYPDNPDGRRLEPRLARVLQHSTEYGVPVPTRVAVLEIPKNRKDHVYYPGKGKQKDVSIPKAAAPYRGGMGGGVALPDDLLPVELRGTTVRTHIEVKRGKIEYDDMPVPDEVIGQYLRTLEHLTDTEKGHFSSRHPRVGKNQERQSRGRDILKKTAGRVFQPGDYIWVELDTNKSQIVSFGWHYYYRWAYTDTVHYRGVARKERDGLFPLAKERELENGESPRGLSPVRRLFGYAGDNEGSKGIGKRDYTQLMGRVSINAALEIVNDGDTDDVRFLKPTFLKELGMPRPSAVEHYLKQENIDEKRPSDNAKLVTYGDAAGYDASGEIAGRKFYLDREGSSWEDATEANRLNERSTLALEVSREGRRFRFTLRFRDLEASELAAILVAFCPDQFKEVLGGKHEKGYCSKLGYARPLGWGSVEIKAKELLFLDVDGETPTLGAVKDLKRWLKNEYPKVNAPMQDEWLAIHRREHPDAGDYPVGEDGKICSYHTSLRRKHALERRYQPKGTR